MSEIPPRSSVQSFKKLDVWKRAIELTDVIYRITKSFPRDEMFGLTSQLRRAAVSIPANIAEGAGRRGRGEYAYHVGIARGSTNEVTALLEISLRQGLVSSNDVEEAELLLVQVGQMLSGLLRSLDRDTS